MGDFLTVRITKQPSMIAALGSPLKTAPEVRAYYADGSPVKRFKARALISLVVSLNSTANGSVSSNSTVNMVAVERIPPALLEEGSVAVAVDGVASILFWFRF